ncbi:repetitive proline-rich cell wall protein-like [Daphnia pulicaria]|uniref:repetitive proline-rich cell wall protein-like n=1 Tax=Daphnia pulicaria TaxID=35523 RepID=UPI001EE9B436|nr:repetitive proline-rich cell wall protein-like [Daphnia pulicaria]
MHTRRKSINTSAVSQFRYLEPVAHPASTLFLHICFLSTFLSKMSMVNFVVCFLAAVAVVSGNPGYGYKPMAPAYTPPAYTPPAYTPPAYTPPAYTPPAYSPPAYKAPSYMPPAYTPPAYTPPAYTPPAYTPPAYKASSYMAPAY